VIDKQYLWSTITYFIQNNQRNLPDMARRGVIVSLLLTVCTTLAVSALQQPLTSKTAEIGSNCKPHWYTQRLDHFRMTRGKQQLQGTAVPQPSFQQRVFICDAHWRGPPAPIFFYAGNEGNVEGYIRATGLMHEHAAEFGALLVFAEHRYYGKSQPFGDAAGGESWRVDPSYLTSEQALADYATLLANVTAAWGAQTRCASGALRQLPPIQGLPAYTSVSLAYRSPHATFMHAWCICPHKRTPPTVNHPYTHARMCHTAVPLLHLAARMAACWLPGCAVSTLTWWLGQ
jgi:Serine carboxypeptidase S28